MITRRQLIQLIGSATAVSAFPAISMADGHASKSIIKKTIPSSGESLAVIGMGSARTFNHLDNPEMYPQLIEVLLTFFKNGGQLIDSSPMYGSAEELLGKLMAEIPAQPGYFSASKVWTDGELAGIEGVKESMRRMAVKPMDLMQIHNLRDWQVHLKTLRAMKEAGDIRYIGITTSRLSQYDDFEAVMKAEPMDFIQINYSLTEQKAAERILPLAQDRGMAVLINRPFQRGRLFGMTKGMELPEYAAEFDCGSWAQFFLKYVVSHPAVTCAIPATTKAKNMQDNMQAQFGQLPTAKHREQMLATIQSI